MRVGYLILPQSLGAAVTDLAVSTYISPNVLAQATVWEFVRRGLFEPNLERVQGLLRARRDAMLDALEREFPDEASWNRPEGGYFVWLELPAGTSAADLLTRAEEAGITFVKGSDFYAGGRGGESAARLAFSFVSPEEISEGISRLAKLLPTPAPASV